MFMWIFQAHVELLYKHDLGVVMHIGKAIRKAHELTNIRHTTVAKALGISAANYCHALSQRSMSVWRFKEICDELNMDMSDVYSLGVDPNEEI